MRRSTAMRSTRSVAAIGAMAVGFAAAAGCSRPLLEVTGIEVKPNLEDVAADGSIYTPSTQSFLRHQHWLDEVDRLDLRVEADGSARLVLDAEDDEEMQFVNVEIEHLVPRLFYRPTTPADDFDAFNLMLAEYSRNSVSLPTGDPGDELSHFQTTLDGYVAWTEPEHPYEFRGDRRYRPLRVSVVNNCLGPGLWELSAGDGAGEIYHSWFSFPNDAYHELVAAANGIDDVEFVRDAVIFKTDPVELQLGRLREVEEKVGEVTPRLVADGRSGYSSQDSRRKLAKGYVVLERDGQRVIPEKLSDLTAQPVLLSEFVEPGKYSVDRRRAFDLSWLRDVRSAEVFRVAPRTSYRFLEVAPEEVPADFRGGGYLEIHVHLGEYSLVFGNLPQSMLVPQEDFEIHGFGVGVMSSGEPAERRKLLYEEGPAPSFAYLYRKDGDRLVTVNSHDFGMEQVFLRVRNVGGRMWFEPTITSYERIVDLVKYEIPVPDALRQEMDDLRRRYISPTFLSYQDDNVR